MLTPIEIQGRVLKSGMGYVKKQVDGFLEEIHENYEQLYKENVELKDKMSVLNEGLQYYKTIEKTLQKALVLAEKTSEETKEAAVKKAESIERNAHVNARMIIADAKNESDRLKAQITGIIQQYERYKMQFKQLATGQLELLNSEIYDVKASAQEDKMQMEAEAYPEKTAIKQDVKEKEIPEAPKMPEKESIPEPEEQDAFTQIENALRKQEEASAKTEKKNTQEGTLAEILQKLNMKIAETEVRTEKDDVFEFFDND